MARICKSKGCTNEIPEGWKVPYCDACRYKAAKKARDRLKVVGGILVTVIASKIVVYERREKKTIACPRMSVRPRNDREERSDGRPRQDNP